MTIKTPEEVIASVRRHTAKSAKEKRDHAAAVERERVYLETYEDLRDDVITLVINNKLSFAEIHNRCGPTPKTLEKWMTKQVSHPRLEKVQAVLRILGYDLTVTQGRRRRVKELFEFVEEPPATPKE